MCLIVKAHEGITIAKKDIVVIKYVGEIKTKFLFWKYWVAPCIGTKHKFNRVLESTKHLYYSIDWIRGGRLTIHQGFHAFYKRTPAAINLYDSLTYVYAIIPKGAEYCRGSNNDIVANKMIVFSNKKKYEKYVSISNRKN